ncbi:Hypothetical predicted protein [Olea europaea subsp. europaea]|uniref:Uncharacterized protein n=1 Tax=Olea europaea subsp. europaea TaxID=158383 RepID=A0A8S0TKJ8_OLEEU|nr:Hypothetical predicted protein [Olea europaea subsp. europaea]
MISARRHVGSAHAQIRRFVWPARAGQSNARELQPNSIRWLSRIAQYNGPRALFLRNRHHFWPMVAPPSHLPLFAQPTGRWTNLASYITGRLRLAGVPARVEESRWSRGRGKCASVALESLMGARLANLRARACPAAICTLSGGSSYANTRTDEMPSRSSMMIRSNVAECANGKPDGSARNNGHREGIDFAPRQRSALAVLARIGGESCCIPT